MPNDPVPSTISGASPDPTTARLVDLPPESILKRRNGRRPVLLAPSLVVAVAHSPRKGRGVTLGDATCTILHVSLLPSGCPRPRSVCRTRGGFLFRQSTGALALEHVLCAQSPKVSVAPVTGARRAGRIPCCDAPTVPRDGRLVALSLQAGMASQVCADGAMAMFNLEVVIVEVLSHRRMEAAARATLIRVTRQPLRLQTRRLIPLRFDLPSCGADQLARVVILVSRLPGRSPAIELPRRCAPVPRNF